MVEYWSIMNILNFFEFYYFVIVEDVYLLKMNYVFDVLILELFGWFIGNGCFVIFLFNGEKLL